MDEDRLGSTRSKKVTGDALRQKLSLSRSPTAYAQLHPIYEPQLFGWRLITLPGAPQMQLKDSSSRRCRGLDPGDHVLRIERAVHRAAGQLRFVEPKTPRSRRVLLVPEIAMADFNAHGARQARERLAAGDSWHDGDLISASSIGTPMEPRNVPIHVVDLVTRQQMSQWLQELRRHVLVEQQLHRSALPSGR